MLRLMMFASLGLLTLACGTHAEKAASEPKKSGLKLEYFDTTVKPTDDFYRYANGTWLDTTEIPADKSVYSSFTEISDENDRRIKAIIDEASAGESTEGTQQQVGDFYKSYTNIELLDSLGVSPLKADLDKIAAVTSHEDLQNLMVHLLSIGAGTPARIGVGRDSKDTTRYVLHLMQSGLSLPDRDYYLGESEKMVEVRSAYKKHLETMFTLLGNASPAADAQSVLALETRLATHHWTRVDRRDRNKSYNKFTIDTLEEQAPGFDWRAIFTGLHTSGDIIVGQPSYVIAFAELFTKVDVAQWKTYLTWHLLDKNANILSTPFQTANFDFYGKTLSGTEEQEPLWKRGVNATNQVLGDVVGKVYVEKHFRPEAKAQMEQLVDNLKVAFSKRLTQLDWMSDDTKKEAQTKLAQFTAKVGYPDVWRDYSNLEIKADDLFGNYNRSRIMEFQRDLDRIGQPVDKNEWFMTPQTVNAYYSSSSNEIVFPAAILQPPFFDMNADMAANYGGIGAVIGHEITHGFDDQGRKSDGTGNLRDWWSEQDSAEFDKRAQMVVEQYNSFKPLPDMNVNGKLTLGENIADLGGLTVAYHAYLHSLDGKPAPTLDGFTGEQRVFLAWAQAWRRKYREEALRQRLATDSHSPGEYRARGPVSNMPEFYQAFGVKAGDAMHRDDTLRIKIW